MENLPVIIVLALALIALVAMNVAYYVCEHEAKVVGVLKTGILVYLSDANELVYVGDDSARFKPCLGDVVKVKHSFLFNLHRSKETPKLPTTYDMSFGSQSVFWPKEMGEILDKATLANHLCGSKWLAVNSRESVIVDMDEDDVHAGDEVTYYPMTWTLRRFYYV